MCVCMCLFVCFDLVQGAGNCCVLERLASVKWFKVPAVGGLPG